MAKDDNKEVAGGPAAVATLPPVVLTVDGASIVVAFVLPLLVLFAVANVVFAAVVRTTLKVGIVFCLFGCGGVCRIGFDVCQNGTV